MTEILRPPEAAVAVIEDGMTVVVPPDYSGVAMEATRALIRRGVRNLHLVTLPASSLQADLLIGAGALASIETSAVSLGEMGAGPRFAAAVAAGTIALKDATCPALHAAVQAAEKGVPFMPLRGVIGSDLLKVRPDWKVIENPFAADDPILLVPAIRPDVALFHAPFADRHGNVWIGRRRELVTMAHASVRTIATVEEIRDGNLLEDEILAGATIPAFYVEAVAVAKHGTWPLKFGDRFAEDTAHLREYMRLAATEEGFRQYLDLHVLRRRAA
ncbi:MAG TPA: CoA-transferase [Stellaceae bacterium]|nr:CoA-transferase [Stellaceae bacterium]